MDVPEKVESTTGKDFVIISAETLEADCQLSSVLCDPVERMEKVLNTACRLKLARRAQERRQERRDNLHLATVSTTNHSTASGHVTSVASSDWSSCQVVAVMLVVAGVGVTARLLVAGHSSRQAGGPPYTQQNMSRWIQMKSIF